MRVIAGGAFADLDATIGGAVMVRRHLARVLVDMVDRVLDMLAARPARLAEEGQEDQPPAVEAGQQGRERADPESDIAVDRVRSVARLEDRVLAASDDSQLIERTM